MVQVSMKTCLWQVCGWGRINNSIRGTARLYRATCWQREGSFYCRYVRPEGNLSIWWLKVLCKMIKARCLHFIHTSGQFLAFRKGGFEILKGRLRFYKKKRSKANAFNSWRLFTCQTTGLFPSQLKIFASLTSRMMKTFHCSSILTLHVLDVSPLQHIFQFRSLLSPMTGVLNSKSTLLPTASHSLPQWIQISQLTYD